MMNKTKGEAGRGIGFDLVAEYTTRSGRACGSLSLPDMVEWIKAHDSDQQARAAIRQAHEVMELERAGVDDPLNFDQYKGGAR